MAYFSLSAFSPDHSGPLPQPTALPRIVKQLPPSFSDSQLYDLFRPFGAISTIRKAGPLIKDAAIIEFWREEEAKEAEENMHCAEVGGQNIAVQVYHPQRKPSGTTEFSPNATPFVPSGSVLGSPYSQQVRIYATLFTLLQRDSTICRARLVASAATNRPDGPQDPSCMDQVNKSSLHLRLAQGRAATAVSSIHATYSARSVALCAQYALF